VHASIWHWTQREDCTALNMSIGYWQAARVYVLVGEGENALKYARLCLAASPSENAFAMGYAHEATARAEKLLGHTDVAAEHVAKGMAFAERVTEAEDKKALVADLEEIASA
jgi:hypothetical protein